MNRPLPIPDLWGLHPCASITVNQRPGHPHCKIFSMPQAGRCSHKAAAVRGNCTCGLVEEGRSRGRYPCTVEDPTISLYCRPRTLAWRAPLHTQLRAVCEPQQTAQRGSRNAVEEERFCSDYQNRLTQYSRYIEHVPISNPRRWLLHSVVKRQAPAAPVHSFSPPPSALATPHFSAVITRRGSSLLSQETWRVSQHI